MGLENIAFRIFGKFAFSMSDQFKSIKEYLKLSGIRMTLEEYIAYFLFLIFFVITPVSFVISFLLFYFLLFPKNLPIDILGSLVITLNIIFLAFLFFYVYPYFKALDRLKKLENSLYLGCIYMSAVASGGITPLHTIKFMSKFKGLEEFTDVMKEVVKYVEFYGYDLPKALQVVARQIKSPRVRDLLEGIRSCVISGTPLDRYLLERAKSEMIEYRRKLQEFSNTLNLITEIFITLISFGTAFGLVMATIMSLISGEGMIRLVIPVLLIATPILTIIFVFVVKTISPI